ncbi:MAG: ABC transporter, fused permease protein [uncultured Nocardioides sp.]|uniref:ABC transporter, fused permease protein n=1 Tax=uncultured Nocardioides sp. TaxID=198441 RepID=A0A6J4NZJ3_9ACTN|nr:MAG: ABC transporter, fused permease protein [uncultured Nocardioides sp.]
MLRAALKSLLGRKVRLLMSTFAIVIGVSFVVGTLVFSDTLSRSFTALVASTVGDVVVRPANTDAAGEPTTRTVEGTLVEALADVDGAARADGNVSSFGVYVVDKDGKLVGGNGPPSIGGNWTEAPAGHGLEGMDIIAGRAPEKAGEVALDSTAAGEGGYVIGQQVNLVTATDRGALTAELVGIIGFPEGGSLNGATFAAFDTRTSQELFLDGKDEFTDIWVTAEEGTSQQDLAATVDRELPKGVEAVTGDEAADEAATAIQEAVGFLTTFLLIFAGISLVVGAFLIVNTFSILVAQRSRELALLRALGASKQQVNRSVLFEALVLGLLGSTIGLGLGVLLAMGIRSLFAQFGLDLSGQPLIMEAKTVLAAYAVGVVVTLAAAFFPARRTNRIAPVQAMRDDIAMPDSSLRRRLLVGVVLILAGGAALAAGLLDVVPRPGYFVGAGVLAILLGVASASPVISHPLLAAAAWLYSRVFGSIGALAGQNSLRNPRRTTATSSALMIGLSLACTMAIVGDSAKASVDKTIEENFVGDYVVSSLVGQSFSTRIGEQMADVPGVESVFAQRFAITQMGGEGQGVAAAEPETIRDGFEVDMVAGDLADLVDGTLVLDETYAEEQGVAVGDELTVELADGPNEMEVVGLFAENPILFFPVVTTPQTLVDAGHRDADNFLIVDTDDRGAGVQGALEAVVEESPIVTVKDQQGFAAEQREPIDQLVLMIFALLGLALLIAVLGIVNTLALSIIERTREVGLLRAIGVSRGQLRRMVTLESVVIAVLGAVLGVALGIGFGIALMHSLREEGLEVISVPVDQLVVFLVVSVVIGVLAALLPARRAARLDVLRAIGAE